MTGWVDFGNQSTYHSGYAECTGLSKGTFNYDIKLEVKSGGVILQTYWTDQDTAISKGLHPAAGNIHKTAVTNSRILISDNFERISFKSLSHFTFGCDSFMEGNRC